MNCYLEVVQGAESGKKAVLGGTPVLIGRDPARCTLFLSDPEVSRLHARVSSSPEGSFLLEDLGSTHGTFLNGSPVSGSMQLSPQDTIGVGGSLLVLVQEQSLGQAAGQSAALDLAPGSTAQSLPLTRVLTLPFSGPGTLKWLLGSFLLVLPILSFLAEGYRYRLFQKGTAGSLELPEWDNWGDLFIRGLQFFLIRIVYTLGPLIVFLFFSILVITGTNQAAPGLLLAAMLPGLFLLAAVGFFMPMCWAHFAATGSIAESFRITLIARKIASVFGLYTRAALVMVGIWVTVGLLAAIPYVGFFLALLALFFAYTVSGLLFGEIYRQS